MYRKYKMYDMFVAFVAFIYIYIYILFFYQQQHMNETRFLFFEKKSGLETPFSKSAGKLEAMKQHHGQPTIFKLSHV